MQRGFEPDTPGFEIRERPCRRATRAAALAHVLFDAFEILRGRHLERIGDRGHFGVAGSAQVRSICARNAPTRLLGVLLGIVAADCSSVPMLVCNVSARSSER